MGSMTDERRKEMEEEMMRFEQEIFTFPGENEDSLPSKKFPKGPLGSKLENDEGSRKRKLSPPPALSELLPKVLSKPPPPPPPPPTTSPSQQQHRPLVPPPMPPTLHEDRGPMQFIPQQVQRHPPRPPRPSFPMRPPPPPPSFNQGHMPPFPPMQGHMQGPMPPPMALPPMPMPPMGMPMPMGPRFVPPPPPPPPHMHNIHPQSFMPPQMAMPFREPLQAPTNLRKDIRKELPIVSTPAFYAAPPMKSQSEKHIDTSSVGSNGLVTSVTTTVTATMHQMEEVQSAKAIEEPSIPTSVVGPTVPEPVISKKKEKKKKIIRMAGGQAWEDNSLLDWDPDDFRIFCGDLGNDVTDEVLIRAFSKYPSFVKAKVIRDKRTNKTKGYGFVSFKDPQDFIKAMREMNGRYVGSRPIKLRKSTWRDRNIELVRKKQKEKEKLGLL